MKRKMKSWISLLLCLMMVLQSVTAVAAEPEEGSQQPLTKAELVDYASRMGFTVIRKGRYFSLKEHDSVIIDPEKNCFWRNSKLGNGNSIGKGGSIIDFLLEFTDRSLHEVLKELYLDCDWEEIYLGTNQDEHGKEAAEHMERLVKKERPDIRVVLDLPEGEGSDWNDILRKRQEV